MTPSTHRLDYCVGSGHNVLLVPGSARVPGAGRRFVSAVRLNTSSEMALNPRAQAAKPFINVTYHPLPARPPPTAY